MCRLLLPFLLTPALFLLLSGWLWLPRFWHSFIHAFRCRSYFLPTPPIPRIVPWHASSPSSRTLFPPSASTPPRPSPRHHRHTLSPPSPPLPCTGTQRTTWRRRSAGTSRSSLKSWPSCRGPLPPSLRPCPPHHQRCVPSFFAAGGRGLASI